MKTLIIYSHPNTKGHCSAILDEVKNQLKNLKETFEILDLYKMKYDPILHEKEHYASGNREISKKNKEIQKKIYDSKHLIFIYPVWWGTMPAILKGFFDRVFTPRYAFVYKAGVPRGLLRDKKVAVFITSGAPKFASILGQNPGGSIKKHILWFSGIKGKVFQLGGAKKFSEDKKLKIKRLVNRGTSWLYD